MIESSLFTKCKNVGLSFFPFGFMLLFYYQHPPPPEGVLGIEIGRLVFQPAGITPAKGLSVSSSRVYKYSNSPSQRLCRGKKWH